MQLCVSLEEVASFIVTDCLEGRFTVPLRTSGGKFTSTAKTIFFYLLICIVKVIVVFVNVYLIWFPKFFFFFLNTCESLPLESWVGRTDWYIVYYVVIIFSVKAHYHFRDYDSSNTPTYIH